MRLVVIHLLAGMIGVAAGCGDSSPAFDASLLPDAACPLPDGRLFVLSAFRILGPGLGFDLDGDGTIDNEIGELPEAERQSLNDELTILRENGLLLGGIYVTGWTEPPTDNPDLVAHLVQLTDADRDLSNNLGGEGVFYIDKSAFDLNCNPANAADETTLEGGLLTAARSIWTFHLGTIATLELAGARLAFQFDAGFDTATGLGGAILTPCGLSELPYPTDPSASVIDKLVNDPIIAATVAIDVDRDGDGLEQLIGDGVDIVECVDGDGTRIPGASCVCHPAIADGYTVGIELPLVGGTALRVL